MDNKKHTTTGNTDRRGFTIVEILIVIVVIGILAATAITIVAYRGMQQRASTASYTAAVDQWEKILRMEKSLQGDDFATSGRSCAGRSIEDFPQTNDFAEGQCIKTSSGGSHIYREELFGDWKVDRPSTALPVATATIGNNWIKSRGITLVTIPASGATAAIHSKICWYPQVAGQCGRGDDGWRKQDGTLTGGYCKLSIDVPSE